MPEQAMSTVNGIWAPSGLVIRIVGVPYSLIMVDGMPMAWVSPLDISELRLDRAPPMVYRISDGGGARKKRKIIGNIIWRNVWVLNIMRINPAVRIGRASR